MAVVDQEPPLFDCTILENIQLASPASTIKEIWKALEDAGASEFVNLLPEKLNSRAGLQGGNLSGGQKQRIAIAMAILRKKSILLLDEATSALDNHSENIFQKFLESIRGKMTVVMIAHSESTIRLAEHLIVLDQGRVREQGSMLDISSDPYSYYRTHVMKGHS